MQDTTAIWFLTTSVLLTLLALVAWIDLKTMRIPDSLNAAVFASGLVAPPLLGHHSVLWGLGSSIIAFAAAWLVRTAYRHLRGWQGLGLGDVKLIGAATAWIGIQNLPTMLLIASISALVQFAGVRYFSGRPIDKAHKLPFGPFLALAGLMTWALV